MSDVVLISLITAAATLLAALGGTHLANRHTRQLVRAAIRATLDDDESVRVVITDTNEDDISHNILYKALTQARASLQIFWTAETPTAVIGGLERKTHQKDVTLLRARRGLQPS